MSGRALKVWVQVCGEFLRLAYRHRQLTWEMTRREITDRYVGQVLGAFWAVAHPLCLLAVYIFVFALILRIQIGGTADLPLDYTTYLLAGLIPWMTCTEVLSKSAVALTSNANLVKQVVFPLEVLPLKGVLASLLTELIALGLLAGYILMRFGFLPWTFLLLPLLLVLQGTFLLGAACALAVLGAYLRDLKDLILLFNMIGVYLAPVIYLPHMVPSLFRPLLYFNPFSYLIWCYQDVCFFGRLEHLWAWPVLAGLAGLALAIGYRLFRALKPLLGNVL